ncbi:MAG: hypothetical protein ACRD6U_04335 [Nitrososphaeraceae archaeon]
MECQLMFCYYCNQDQLGEIIASGICPTCTHPACSDEYHHGENCLHCPTFFCIHHQHTHAFYNGLDPFQIFPNTTRYQLNIVSNFLKKPDPNYAAVAVHHGLSLAKKLRNNAMEHWFSILDSIQITDKSEISRIGINFQQDIAKTLDVINEIENVIISNEKEKRLNRTFNNIRKEKFYSNTLAEENSTNNEREIAEENSTNNEREGNMESSFA